MTDLEKQLIISAAGWLKDLFRGTHEDKYYLDLASDLVSNLMMHIPEDVA